MQYNTHILTRYLYFISHPLSLPLSFSSPALPCLPSHVSSSLSLLLSPLSSLSSLLSLSLSLPSALHVSCLPVSVCPSVCCSYFRFSCGEVRMMLPQVLPFAVTTFLSV